MTVKIKKTDYRDHFKKRYVLFMTNMKTHWELEIVWGHLQHLRFHFSLNYFVDESGDDIHISWAPEVENYVPPKVVDARMKYTGTEDISQYSPESKRRYQAAMRMRRWKLNKEESAQE